MFESPRATTVNQPSSPSNGNTATAGRTQQADLGSSVENISEKALNDEQSMAHRESSVAQSGEEISPVVGESPVNAKTQQ